MIVAVPKSALVPNEFVGPAALVGAVTLVWKNACELVGTVAPTTVSTVNVVEATPRAVPLPVAMMIFVPPPAKTAGTAEFLP